MNEIASATSGWLSSWIAHQSTLLLWLLTAGSICVLIIGADKTVSSAVALARGLGMSTVIIGATVVSLGTTTPEMFTSVTAAFRGESGLALGNGVGSIICDTGLIFGLSCLLTRLPADKRILNRQGWLQLASGVLLAGICGTIAIASGQIGRFGPDNAGTWNTVPRWIGGIMVVLLMVYLYLSVRWAREKPKIVEKLIDTVSRREKTIPPTHIKKGYLAVWRSLIILVIGLTMIACGANVLIPSVSNLAIRYGVPKDFLAVTIVALGTSLPELVTAIAAIVKGHKGLLVGNIIGADILNVLFVVGLSSCAAELSIPPTFYILHLPVMLTVLILLRIWVFTARGVSPSTAPACLPQVGRGSPARSDQYLFHRWQGIPLLAIYIGYIAVLTICASQFGDVK